MKRKHETRRVVDLGAVTRETKGAGIYRQDGVGKLPSPGLAAN